MERRRGSKHLADVRKVSVEKLDAQRSTYFWLGAILLLPELPFVFFDHKTCTAILIFLPGGSRIPSIDLVAAPLLPRR